MKKICLKVEGMMCTGCERRIENALKEKREIDEVKADHTEGTVKITLREDVDYRAISERVEDLGFSVKEVKEI